MKEAKVPPRFPMLPCACSAINSQYSQCRRCSMAHLLTSDTKDPDLTCDDAYRLFLITRRKLLVDYRFGRTQVKRDRFRGGRSFRGVKGLLKNMIEAIANAKMLRMERQLQLRGS